jgi:hypothetical protein
MQKVEIDAPLINFKVFVFFLTAKVLLIIQPTSAQNEQRSEKRNYKTKVSDDTLKSLYFRILIIWPDD